MKILYVIILCSILSCSQAGKGPEEKKIYSRIISLDCSITDTLYKIGAERSVVGITSYCENSVGIKDKTVVGRGFGDINIEAVIILNPDLIICWKGKDEEILKKRGFNLYIIGPHTVKDVIVTVEKLGAITGREKEAAMLAADMNERLKKISDKLSDIKNKPKVYFEDRRPYGTRSKGSLADDMIRIAGGINVAGNMNVPFPTVNGEFVINSKPDVIIFENSAGNDGRINKRPGWSSIPAVKNGRVFVQKGYYTHYSYRCIEGIEMYAKWLHPEIFK